jgi:hypothetical protein
MRIMAKLAGDAVVYYDGGIIRPGDDLPKELAHLADEPDTEPSPASSGAGIDPEFNADKATVPQLRAELDRLGVEYDDDDRKDALKAKYEGRVRG